MAILLFNLRGSYRCNDPAATETSTRGASAARHGLNIILSCPAKSCSAISFLIDRARTGRARPDAYHDFFSHRLPEGIVRLRDRLVTHGSEKGIQEPMALPATDAAPEVSPQGRRLGLGQLILSEEDQSPLGNVTRARESRGDSRARSAGTHGNRRSTSGLPGILMPSILPSPGRAARDRPGWEQGPRMLPIVSQAHGVPPWRSPLPRGRGARAPWWCPGSRPRTPGP